ncbi:RNA polymerase sigma factor [Roseitranquillus sediminis]|uniref:RNA polymerase sigma factor n=1 Tax=Roseitranquillus sediminis TaxID=2809051 RepID=UPI001D0CDACE|nr:RNA polymerase sigma factor [Roseitranquillus sediminis]MBM9596065.1 RNA polymerase sigma factor [Roseitranquillus sediminis]
MPMPLDENAESDEALVAAYGRGDAAAARMLTMRLVPRAFRHAVRMLGGDRAEADDVAQEAMLRLWRSAPEWRPEARVTTWLYRVVANLCIDRLRRSTRSTGIEAAGDPADGAPGAVARLVERDRAAALETALAALPERQCEAVVLRHLEGLANPEIAEVMGIGIEAVESLTARGKRALAAALRGRREELGYDES